MDLKKIPHIIGPVKRPYFFVIIVIILIFIGIFFWWHLEKKRPEELRLTIVHSANMSGKLDPCGCLYHQLGGLAYRSTLIKKIKLDSEEFLLFDSGDLLFEYYDINFFPYSRRIPRAKENASLIVEILNTWDVTAVTLGERDLGAGYEEWVRLQKKANYPVLSINARDEDGIIKPYLIKLIKGIKILITGVTGAVEVAPYFITDKIKVIDYREPLKKLIEREGADLVIVLSHSGYLFDIDIPRDVPGVDLILGAHTLAYKKADRIRGAMIVHTGEEGQNISKTEITLRLDKGTNTYTKEIESEILEVDPKLPPDKKIMKMLEKK